MTEIQKLQKRVDDLEAEVARLKAIPPNVIHQHYHYGSPAYVPQPCFPAWPQYPYITYGVDNRSGAV